MSDATDRLHSDAPESEAVATVLERFEAYVEDFETRLKHGALAGSAGEGEREEAERLVAEYRRRIEHAGDPAKAEEALESFKEEARRLRP